jgi:hypothetical protein
MFPAALLGEMNIIVNAEVLFFAIDLLKTFRERS